MLLVGAIGPRGDGYVAGETPDPDEAAEYHAHQIRSFAAAGADLVSAMTMTSPQEAMGVVGRRPARGHPGRDRLHRRDRRPAARRHAAAATRSRPSTPPAGRTGSSSTARTPPTSRPAFDGGAWQSRIAGLRPNASTMTHAELDAMEELDEGDLGLLASSLDALRPQLPSLAIVGGCCGTDSRHVAALWGVG